MHVFFVDPNKNVDFGLLANYIPVYGICIDFN